MESVQKQLEELGLSPNEVKAYLASLELGAATAQQIAAKAAVPRPTTYVAIGGLVKRGLVSSHTRGKKQYFQAERPEILMHILNEEKKKILEKESKLKRLMPGLESLISIVGEKLEVKYYENWEGLEAMQSYLLDSGVKTFDVIRHANVAMASKNRLPAEKSINYGLELVKRGIGARQIIISKQSALSKWRPITFNPKVKSKVFPKEEFNFSGELAIFKDCLTLVSYQDKPYGCLVRSKDIVQIVRLMFECMWNSKLAKNLPTK